MGRREANCGEKLTLMSGMWRIVVVVVVVVLLLDLPLGAYGAPTNGTKLAPVVYTMNTQNTSHSGQRSSQFLEQEVLPESNSSLSSPDFFGVDDSSPSFSSYGLQEDVEENNADELLSHCLDNQFWDSEKRECANCTICHPGTEHVHGYRCGFGYGQKDVCQACEDGFYQDSTFHTGLRCRGCIECDPATDELRECHVMHNRQCGPCPRGYFERSRNICEQCSHETDSPSCIGFVSSTPVAISTQETTHDSNETVVLPTGTHVLKPDAVRIALVLGIIIAVLLGGGLALYCIKKRYGPFWGREESQVSMDSKPTTPSILSDACVGHVLEDDETTTASNAEEAEPPLSDHTYIAMDETDAPHEAAQQIETERLVHVGAGNLGVSNLSDPSTYIQTSSMSRPGTLTSRQLHSSFEPQNSEEAASLLDSANSAYPGLEPLVMDTDKKQYSGPNSPDSAVSNISFQNDDGDDLGPLSIPGILRSYHEES